MVSQGRYKGPNKYRDLQGDEAPYEGGLVPVCQKISIVVEV